MISAMLFLLTRADATLAQLVERYGGGLRMGL
jgi:hypothetical protein